MYKIYFSIVLMVLLVGNQGFSSGLTAGYEAVSPASLHGTTAAASGGSAIPSSAKIPSYLQKIYSFFKLKDLSWMLQEVPESSRLIVVAFLKDAEGEVLTKLEAYVKAALEMSRPEDVSKNWLPFSYLYDTHLDWLPPVIQQEVRRLRAIVGSEALITLIQSAEEQVGHPTNPREWLQRFLYEARLSGLRQLLDRNWEYLYYSLWTERNFYGDAYVREKFGDIINLMASEGKIFDSSLTKPCTENGFFEESEVRRPHSGQSVLIVGGGKSEGSLTKEEEKTRPDVYYSVNILKNQEPDLLADINVPTQIASLPSGSFNHIRTDHVPIECYWCDSFFRSANRLLKIGGELYIQGRVLDKITRQVANERLAGFGFDGNGSSVYIKVRDL